MSIKSIIQFIKISDSDHISGRQGTKYVKGCEMESTGVDANKKNQWWESLNLFAMRKNGQCFAHCMMSVDFVYRS